jgi:hypothetical protein
MQHGEIKMMISKINNFKFFTAQNHKLEFIEDNQVKLVHLTSQLSEDTNDTYSKILYESNYYDEVVLFLKGMIEMYYLLR